MQRSSTPPDAAKPQSADTLRAIALMLVAVCVFSCLDATAKYLVMRRHLPALEVSWLRFLGQTLYMLAIFWMFRLPALLRTTQFRPQMLRSSLMLVCTYCNFLALKDLRLDQTITIVFLSPLIIALLAGPFLGEWVGWRRMIAILVGFCGVLVAMRPGVTDVPPAALYSLLSVVSYSVFAVITRRIAAFDPPFVTLFYSMLVGAVVLAPMAWSVWVPPRVEDWLLLAALGAFGGIGHYLFILAYRLAPAGIVAPFLYFQLLTMLALGYLVFGDVPDLWTMVGAGIVVASGIYLLHRERLAHKAAI